jgi:hypothetical protein
MDGQARGMTIELLEGYLILINEALCDGAKWRTFMHELQHVVNDDFNRGQLVCEIERRRSDVLPELR